MNKRLAAILAGASGKCRGSSEECPSTPDTQHSHFKRRQIMKNSKLTKSIVAIIAIALLVMNIRQFKETIS